MSTPRKPSVGATVVALLAAASCSRTDTARSDRFLDRIAHARDSEIPTLLYRYGQLGPNAQGRLLNSVSLLRSPTPKDNLRVSAMRNSRAFTIMVVELPWRPSGCVHQQYPILIHDPSDDPRMVGYVLPFDDIAPLLSREELAQVAELSAWCIDRYGCMPANPALQPPAAKPAAAER